MRIKFIIPFAVFFLFTISVAVSQPGGGGPGGGGDPDVPITGIEILLAAGGLLGVRRLINSKKKSK